MTHRTLISTDDLNAHLNDPAWVGVDCRFDLADPDAGFARYREGHVPGAVYAHLDHDLAGPATKTSGRHPLPDWEAFKRTLGAWGISNATQVVAYDDLGGAIAARLWWALRCLGHEAAAVLDGGFPKWAREGRPLQVGVERNAPATFQGTPRTEGIATLVDVEAMLEDPEHLLIDARSPERYRGEEEPIDPVAGHIPGARNRYYGDNLRGDGTFKPAASLREEFQNLLGSAPPEDATVYCGSGVSACHHLLALAHAGLSGARLYVGSWSQWCAEPGRPVARAPELR